MTQINIGSGGSGLEANNLGQPITFTLVANALPAANTTDSTSGACTDDASAAATTSSVPVNGTNGLLQDSRLKCSYWNETSQTWLDHGCSCLGYSLLPDNKITVHCSCVPRCSALLCSDFAVFLCRCTHLTGLSFFLVAH